MTDKDFIDQDTINKLFTLITEVTENIGGELRNEIDKMECSGDKEDVKKAQELKRLTNELDSLTNKNRAEYPHLFVKEKQSK